MGDFPGENSTFRELENRSGVSFVAEKLNVLYAEDWNYLCGEILAIETVLGTDVAGEYDTVSERIAALEGGGSGGCSFGTDGQIPYTNEDGDDFDYSANFTFLQNDAGLWVGNTDAINNIYSVRTVITNTPVFGLNIDEIWENSYSCINKGAGKFKVSDSRDITSGIDSPRGLQSYFLRTADFSSSSTSTHSLYAFDASFQDLGSYTNAQFVWQNYQYGMRYAIDVRPDVNYTGSLYAKWYLYGIDISIAFSPDITGTTAGKFHGFLYGVHLQGNPASGKDTTYYAYYNSVDTTDYNWNIYNDSQAHNYMGEDNAKTYYGTGKDVAMWFDNTHFHIDARVVGSGCLLLDNLPTSNPSIANALWNDSGTVKISAG